MPGFLVPPWYHDDGPSDALVRLALLTIGFFTAVTCFTLVKLIYQTYWFWVRSLKPNEYLYMVWGGFGSSPSPPSSCGYIFPARSRRAFGCSLV